MSDLAFDARSIVLPFLAEIPQIAEPLFMKLDAAVEFTPVMNKDDLQKALAKVLS